MPTPRTNDLARLLRMTLTRWLCISGFFAMLPITGIVPRGSLAHTLCVLPFGLTMLAVVPAVFSLAAVAGIRSLLH